MREPTPTSIRAVPDTDPPPDDLGDPPPSWRVLVVDDDPMVVDVVTRYLGRAGFDVHTAVDGPGAVAACHELEPDLVVLDLMLPGFDGFEVFRRIRADRDVPVIMLTALGGDDDRLTGLELGADDYLGKPFSPRELALRARNLARRVNPPPTLSEPPVITSGDLHLDGAARAVTLAGQPITLTTLEFDLLAFLMRHQGRACTRDELFEHVWGYTIGDTATVTVHIRRLREKVEVDPTTPVRIATVWGYGYRFDA